MEFVRADHAVDLPSAPVRIEVRERRPETCDLEHHLGPVFTKEIGVVRDLVVVPDVVEDRGIDVALIAAEITLPPPGQRVGVNDLGLLLAVASALPRIHGAGQARSGGIGASLADAAVAVHQ